MATHNPSSGAWNDYIYANGRLIAESPGAQGSGVTFRLGDHLDTLAKTTDGVGNVLGSNDYTPFGQVVEGTAQSLIQFTDHEADPENSTDHTLNRQFSLAQSRWTRPDPSNSSYNLYDPQSFNRYAYVSNRPNNATDPLGLDDGDGPCGIICTIGTDILSDLGGLFGGGGGAPLPGEQTNPSPADTSAGDSSMPGDEVGQPDWDQPVLDEQLGLPPSIAAQLGSGGLLDVVGLGTDTCEFGVCGDDLTHGTTLSAIESRLACAAKFGQAHSIGAAFGGGAIAQFLGGNSVSSLITIVSHPPSIVSGGLGLPVNDVLRLTGNKTQPLYGSLSGTIRSSVVKGAVNSFVGTRDGIVSLSGEASIASFGGSATTLTTAAEAASYVGLAKFGVDTLTVVYGALVACR